MPDTPDQHPELRTPHERQLPADAAAWDRLAHEGWCYPGEASRILGITELDYQQLRTVYKLARELTSDPAHRDPEAPEGRWSRYTARDLACAGEIVRLCVRPNPQSTRGGMKLNTAQLANACRRLVAQGISNPLLELHFEWSGGRLIATSGGVTFDAGTGQTVLAAVAARLRAQQPRGAIDPRLARVIRNERAVLKRDRSRSLRMDPRPPRGPGQNPGQGSTG